MPDRTGVKLNAHGLNHCSKCISFTALRLFAGSLVQCDLAYNTSLHSDEKDGAGLEKRSVNDATHLPAVRQNARRHLSHLNARKYKLKKSFIPALTSKRGEQEA